jgi:hypothetical protein
MGFSTLSDIFRVNLGTAPTLNSGIILYESAELTVPEFSAPPCPPEPGQPHSPVRVGPPACRVGRQRPPGTRAAKRRARRQRASVAHALTPPAAAS